MSKTGSRFKLYYRQIGHSEGHSRCVSSYKINMRIRGVSQRIAHALLSWVVTRLLATGMFRAFFQLAAALIGLRVLWNRSSVRLVRMSGDATRLWGCSTPRWCCSLESSSKPAAAGKLPLSKDASAMAGAGSTPSW